MDPYETACDLIKTSKDSTILKYWIEKGSIFVDLHGEVVGLSNGKEVSLGFIWTPSDVLSIETYLLNNNSPELW